MRTNKTPKANFGIMQLTVNIPFTDLLNLVGSLTPAQRAELQAKLDNTAAPKPSKARLKELLLKGPALTDGQLEVIAQNRKAFNQ